MSVTFEHSFRGTRSAFRAVVSHTKFPCHRLTLSAFRMFDEPVDLEVAARLVAAAPEEFKYTEFQEYNRLLEKARLTEDIRSRRKIFLCNVSYRATSMMRMIDRARESARKTVGSRRMTISAQQVRHRVMSLS